MSGATLELGILGGSLVLTLIHVKTQSKVIWNRDTCFFFLSCKNFSLQLLAAWSHCVWTGLDWTRTGLDWTPPQTLEHFCSPEQMDELKTEKHTSCFRSFSIAKDVPTTHWTKNNIKSALNIFSAFLIQYITYNWEYYVIPCTEKGPIHVHFSLLVFLYNLEHYTHSFPLPSWSFNSRRCARSFCLMLRNTSTVILPASSLYCCTIQSTTSIQSDFSSFSRGIGLMSDVTPLHRCCLNSWRSVSTSSSSASVITLLVAAILSHWEKKDKTVLDLGLIWDHRPTV